jgi:histidinol-phosphate/aromatic aminotransferase/cobyric acid decarboxylase-like protein
VRAGELLEYLSQIYKLETTKNLRLHSAGVGGLIEAATKYMHLSKPGFRTCLLVPEYWDLLRCVLTYSPKGVSIVDGRHEPEFPIEAWLGAISAPEVDFSYISFTNNPLGTTISKDVIHAGIEAINDDALFFIDCTSVDTEESSNEKTIIEILSRFSKKNLLITKSFSKEYNQGHIRVGYGIFTRSEVAKAFDPLLSGNSPQTILVQAISCLKQGNQHVLDAYRRTRKLLEEFAKTHPKIRVSGTTSNYTSLFFSSSEACDDALGKIANTFEDMVYPGELPMQGGGEMGLADGEVSLTSMKQIPYLPTNAIRLLVSTESICRIDTIV